MKNKEISVSKRLNNRKETSQKDTNNKKNLFFLMKRKSKELPNTFLIQIVKK